MRELKLKNIEQFFVKISNKWAFTKALSGVVQESMQNNSYQSIMKKSRESLSPV